MACGAQPGRRASFCLAQPVSGMEQHYLRHQAIVPRRHPPDPAALAQSVPPIAIETGPHSGGYLRVGRRSAMVAERKRNAGLSSLKERGRVKPGFPGF
jgi:hypothetical protein